MKPFIETLNLDEPVNTKNMGKFIKSLETMATEAFNRGDDKLLAFVIDQFNNIKLPPLTLRHHAKMSTGGIVDKYYRFKASLEVKKYWFRHASDEELKNIQTNQFFPCEAYN